MSMQGLTEFRALANTSEKMREELHHILTTSTNIVGDDLTGLAQRYNCDVQRADFDSDAYTEMLGGELTPRELELVSGGGGWKCRWPYGRQRETLVNWSAATNSSVRA